MSTVASGKTLEPAAVPRLTLLVMQAHRDRSYANRTEDPQSCDFGTLVGEVHYFPHRAIGGMDMRKTAGLTLLELLTVLVIVALLSALLLAGVAEARKRSYRTVCTSNLRQLVAAAVMYREDYGELPRFQFLTVPYVKERSLYTCPADPFRTGGGASFSGRTWAQVYGYQMAVSYEYIREHTRDDEYLRLVKADSNHGVFVCPLHDKCDWRWAEPAGVVECLDGVLRARIDGSVQWVRVPMRFFICRGDGAYTGARDGWRLFTDVPCPPDICNDTDC